MPAQLHKCMHAHTQPSNNRPAELKSMQQSAPSGDRQKWMSCMRKAEGMANRTAEKKLTEAQ